jgi:two-component system sensor histidine kinase KdpD
VLYARAPGATLWAFDDARQILAVANVAAAFLERHRLGAESARVVALHESDQLKSTLVSSVSHELKTPLAAVMARVTGLLEEGESVSISRVRDELAQTSGDLARLDASIRDLLDASRLESDSWRPRPDDYLVTEMLGSVAALLPAGDRSRVRFEIDDGVPPLHVDFSQWVRAVSHVIENALAYSPSAESVTVGARVLGADVIVWVEDRGAGVPDADKERIFGKFQRGPAAADSPSGTGLGLAIAREIVRSHGGHVWVEDATPVGSRFLMSWPYGERGVSA